MTGATMGLMFGCIYGVYGLGLWYGVKLIKDDQETEEYKECTKKCVENALDETKDELFECLSNCGQYTVGSITVALFGIVQGGMQIGQSSTFAEALNTARAAAFSIFKVINRQ